MLPPNIFLIIVILACSVSFSLLFTSYFELKSIHADRKERTKIKFYKAIHTIATILLTALAIVKLSESNKQFFAFTIPLLYFAFSSAIIYHKKRLLEE
jgi:hypothetical protein